MVSTSKLFAWGIAAVAVIVVAVLAVQTSRLQTQLEQARAELVEQDKTVGAQQESLAKLARSLEKEVEQLEKELQASQALVKALESETAQASEGEGLSEGGREVETTGQKAGDENDEAGEERASREKKVIDAQISMVADMAYKSLFDDLSLPPDIQAAAKELLVRAAIEEREAALAAMKANSTPAYEVKRQKDGIKDRLRDELSQVLTPEELAAWENYESYADQVLFENLVEGQLTMLAPGLTPDNRTMATQVFAEELVVHLDAYENSDTVFSMTSFNDAQLAALRQGLERLAEPLDEEQFAQAQCFVDQVAGVFAAMAE